MGHIVTPLSKPCDSVRFSQVIRRHADIMTLLQGAEKARRVLFASSVIIQFPFQKLTVRGCCVFVEGDTGSPWANHEGGAGNMFFCCFFFLGRSTEYASLSFSSDLWVSFERRNTYVTQRDI